LGGLDSLGGAVLGIVRTGFFISLLVWVLGRIELDVFKDWEKKSEYLSYLKPLTPGVLEILSPILPTVKEAGQELLEKVEKRKWKSELNSFEPLIAGRSLQCLDTF
jgi:membrane protein required for colicin V production